MDNIVSYMKQYGHFDNISVFISIIKFGSFTKAAKSLGIPKSKVSRSLHALERELGVQLLYRTTRKLQLTRAGQELYGQSTVLMERLGGLIDRVGGKYSTSIEGVIRLSAPEDMGVALIGKICDEFIQIHPRVQIELVLSDRIVDLVDESFDLAIRLGKLKDSTLLVRRIGVAKFILVAPNGYLKQSGEIKKIEDLNSHHFLNFSGVEHRSLYLFEKGRNRVKVKPNIVFSSNNLFVLRDMLLRGRGLQLMPEFMAKEIVKRGLAQVLFEDWECHSSPVQIVLPPQQQVPAHIRAFSDFLFDRLKSAFG